jgi:hypothetical protein
LISKFNQLIFSTLKRSISTNQDLEDSMYHLPPYLWAMTIAGIIAFPAVTCIVLYGGAKRAGLGRRAATGLTAGAAVVLGGWLAASAVIAGHGWYHTRLGHSVPWMPVAVVGFLATLLALSRIPVVARVLDAPGMVSKLLYPHSFRVDGVVFLLAMALGHLPALFALPAGLGDIAAGLAAPLVARRLARGTGRRSALWFNAWGITDLVTALVLGALVGYQLVRVTPAGSLISELPLVLIPTAAVPLLFVLHLTSVRALIRGRRPAAAPQAGGARPRTALADGPASRA